MSITFTEYQQQDSSKAGYFRIGHIVLRMPPTDILTNRITNKDRVTVLRGKNDMVKMSGQARWDFTARWTAMLNDLAVDDADRFRDWEDLRSVLAMFRAAPFVEVENGYIRQVLSEQDPSLKSSRIGVGLRQLRVSTHPDIIDAFDVALTMTLFNYQPYTPDFAYEGANGKQTDAYLCPEFQAYIDGWKQQNLDAARGSDFDGAPSTSWKSQIPGTLKVRWREYKTVKIGLATATDIAPSSVAGLTASTQSTPQKSTATITPSGQYDSIIQQQAQIAGISPAMAKAVMMQESGGKAAAVQPNFKGNATNAGNSTNSVIATLRQHIQQDADGGLAFVRQYTAQNGQGPDLGLMQLNWKVWSKQYPNLAPADYFDPTTNINIGCQYLAQLYSQGMTDQTVYWYNTGPDPKDRKTPNPPNYASLVLAKYQQYAVQQVSTSDPLQAAAQAQPSATPTQQQTVPLAQVNTGTTGTGGQLPGNQLTADQQQQILNMVEDGWQLDHWVNDFAFFFKENEIRFTDEEHGDRPNTYDMFPTQFSMLFVNNLAQVPLAAYQYPTYQHVGSPSSQVTMSFISKGERASDEIEPSHPGISRLASVSEFLEDQFLRLRTTWRAVTSVHRMQAVYVENQVLNMLGIRGLMFDGLSTESIPNASDLVQVELAATQYENIFENIGPFQINSIDGAVVSTIQTAVNNGSVSALSSSEKNTIPEVSGFASAVQSGDPTQLNSYMLSLGANQSASFSTMSQTAAVAPTGAQKSAILSLGTQSQDTYPSIAARLAQVGGGSQMTYGDVLLANAICSNPPAVIAGTTQFSTAQAATTALVSANNNATNNSQFFNTMFSLLSSFDSSFANDVNTLAKSPAYSDQIQSTVSPSGPGSDSTNKGHGAYKDLGLKSLALNGEDFNPGFYFYDHNTDYLKIVRSNIEQVVNGAQQTSGAVNQPVRSSEYDITITESTYVGQNANVNSLVKMTNIPGYSMSEAFPTFKLFLMEDSAEGLVQCFDNFYSYATVTEMEVMRYRDKPDVAVIQITNLANLLQHKLFDDTMQGRYEASLEPFMNTVPSSGGAVSGGDPNSAILVGKTVSGQLYQRALTGRNLSDGMGAQVERIPLQYIALQPGTKIQVRMGYANNPDHLTPVFTGRVARIDGDDLITITAESYLAELCDLPILDDKPVTSKTYGGIIPWHDAGDTASVVENLLTTDTAKHFGRFKLSAVPDQMVQGFTWENRLGAVVGLFSLSPTNTLSKIGAAMASSYDRHAENILINHVINHTGNVTQDRGARSWFDESTSFLWLNFSYRIPDNCTKTTWELIQDVCRRYPEYIVTAKQYGFPYSADATLVVAHPLDWYFGRPPMVGDAEAQRASSSMDTEFQQWWQSGGQQKWQAMIQQLSSLGFNSFSGIPTPTNPRQFTDTLNNLSVETQGFIGLNDPTGLDALLDKILAQSWDTTEKPRIDQARRDLDAVLNSWLAYVQQQNPTPHDRLKPVRRYHFIDHTMIVHNGIRLNDKIYNAIRVGNDTKKVNANIPSHHTRVLDVTDLLNDPKENVENQGDHVVKAVQQSFMKEEVGKMYEGELVLRGVPEIEPYDHLILLDPSTAMTGILEVDRVLHSFSQETGYITIVYPRCVTAINESASANVNRMFAMIMAKSLASFNGLGQEVEASYKKAVSGGITNAATSGVAATAGAVAAGGLLTWGAVSLLGGPPAWAVVALAGVTLVGGMLVTGYQNETGNMIEVLPITRFGRPWMGGLEGYQISDVWRNIANAFNEFKADEIYPLIDTYRRAKGYTTNTLPVQ